VKIEDPTRTGRVSKYSKQPQRVSSVTLGGEKSWEEENAQKPQEKHE